MTDDQRRIDLDGRIELVRGAFLDLIDVLCNTSSPVALLDERVGLLEQILYKQITAVTLETVGEDRAIPSDLFGPKFIEFVRQFSDARWAAFLASGKS